MVGITELPTLILGVGCIICGLWVLAAAWTTKNRQQMLFGALFLATGGGLIYLSAQPRRMGLTVDKVIMSTGLVTAGEPTFVVSSSLSGTPVIVSIPMGSLTPGQTFTKTFWVINQSSTPITSINATIINWVWQPSAQPNPSAYFQIQWVYDNSPLQPNAVRQCMYRVYVLPTITIITDFSYDIVLTATGGS